MRRLGKILLVFVCWLSNAVFLICPFAQVNHLAAFTAKWAEAIADIPLMFVAAMGAGHDGQFFAGHYVEMLQNVNLNGTSCSNNEDLAS